MNHACGLDGVRIIKIFVSSSREVFVALMLRSVEVENFKTFTEKQTIELCHPDDVCGLSIIVGRNGTGKSCVMEAIEWVLFDSTRKDVRVTSTDQLVNCQVRDTGEAATMSVTVHLVHPLSGAKLVISKRYGCAARRVSYSGVFTPPEASSSSVVRSRAEVASLLQDHFDLDPGRHERMVFKQNSTAVVRRTPLELLAFIERMAGTEGLGDQLSELGVETESLHATSVGTEERLHELQVECGAQLRPAAARLQTLLAHVAAARTHHNALLEQTHLLGHRHCHLSGLATTVLPEGLARAATANEEAEIALAAARTTASAAEAEVAQQRRGCEAARTECSSTQAVTTQLERRLSRVLAELRTAEAATALAAQEQLKRQAALDENTTRQEALKADVGQLEQRARECLAAVECAGESAGLAAQTEHRDIGQMRADARRAALAEARLQTTCAHFAAEERLLQGDLARCTRRVAATTTRLGTVRAAAVGLAEQLRVAAAAEKERHEREHHCAAQVAALAAEGAKLRASLAALEATGAAARCVEAVRRCGAVLALVRQEYAGSDAQFAGDVLGMLGDLVAPRLVVHGLALLTLFRGAGGDGGELSSTIVVRSREAAQRVSAACMRSNRGGAGPPLAGITLIIADEFRPCPLPSGAAVATMKREKCVAVSAALEVAHPLLQNYVRRRAHGWCIFEGTPGQQVPLDLARRLGGATGAITLDGMQFQGSGEIATGRGRATADNSGGGVVWPSSKLLGSKTDPRACGDTAGANANTTTPAATRTALKEALTAVCTQLKSQEAELGALRADNTRGRTSGRQTTAALTSALNRALAQETELLAELHGKKTGRGTITVGGYSGQQVGLEAALAQLGQEHVAAERHDREELTRLQGACAAGGAGLRAALEAEEACAASLEEARRCLSALISARQLLERQARSAEAAVADAEEGPRRRYRAFISPWLPPPLPAQSAWSYEEHAQAHRRWTEGRQMAAEELSGRRVALATATKGAAKQSSAVAQMEREARCCSAAVAAAREAVVAAEREAAASHGVLLRARAQEEECAAATRPLLERFQQMVASLQLAEAAAAPHSGMGTASAVANENVPELLSTSALLLLHPNPAGEQLDASADGGSGSGSKRKRRQAAARPDAGDREAADACCVDPRVLAQVRARIAALALDLQCAQTADSDDDGDSGGDTGGVIGRYISGLQAAAVAGCALAELRVRVGALQTKQQAVYTERCERVLQALRGVNRCIGRIYSYLSGAGAVSGVGARGSGRTDSETGADTDSGTGTGGTLLQHLRAAGCGDEGGCYLHFASDAATLFAEGVTLLAAGAGAQAGGTTAWLTASKLSGGQQCACAVALLLALQEEPAAAPPPRGAKSAPGPAPMSTLVCLLDEIDASLDSCVVFRLGKLLQFKAWESRRQVAAAVACRAGAGEVAAVPVPVPVLQFVCVSHRPELHASASRLVGLFAHTHSSRGAGALLLAPRVLSLCFIRGAPERRQTRAHGTAATAVVSRDQLSERASWSGVSTSPTGTDNSDSDGGSDGNGDDDSCNRVEESESALQAPTAAPAPAAVRRRLVSRKKVRYATTDSDSDLEFG